MAAQRPTLVLMAKPPLIGRVKTRLAREIGPVPAVGFYRRATQRLLQRLGRDPRWRTVLAVNAPATAQYGAWPPGLQRVGQGEGSLGDRLDHVLTVLPKGPVLIIGTDSPQLEPTHIAEGFDLLRRREAVFGPAPDGGYWLIGLQRRRPLPGLFDGVRWSTENALGDTVANLPPQAKVGYLRVMTDVDEKSDLRQLLRHYGPFRFGPWGDYSASFNDQS